jgi:hypothetical protein
MLLVSGGAVSGTPTIYHGGYGYVTSETITISAATLGAGGTGITLTVASLENNNASNMFLVGNQTNITLMTMRGLTGTPTAGGTGKAAVVSLDPSGTYYNCFSIHTRLYFSKCKRNRYSN